jgi:hypothetical protein
MDSEGLQLLKLQSTKSIKNSNLFRSENKLEESRSLFFKIGSISVYSDCILIFKKLQGKESIWYPIDA